MRPFTLTNATEALLRELSLIKASRFDRFWNPEKGSQAKLFAEIAALDELEAIPDLTHYLVAPPRIRDLAADCIESIVGNRSLDQLALLDVPCRKYPKYPHPSWNWRAIKPNKMTVFSGQISVVGILSFHPNGWVRQMALDLLADSSEPTASKYIWLRVNDWVDPIRGRAVLAAQRCLHSNKMEPLSEFLPFVHGLKDKRRADFSLLQKQFEQRLFSQPEQLNNALSSEDFRTRRMAYDVVWRVGEGSQGAVVQSALADTDPLVRLGAAHHLAQRAKESGNLDILKPLWSDGWYAVRLIATRAAIAMGERDVLPNLVLDRSRAVRELARFHLRTGAPLVANASFIDAYRRELATGDVVVGLSGLSEVGGVAESAEVLSYLGDTQPRVIEAAIYALARLAPDFDVDRIGALLPSAHPRVSRAAQTVLMSNRTTTTLVACSALVVDENQPKHVQVNAYRLLMTQGKWPRLLCILNTLTLSDKRLVKLAQIDLSRWLYVFNHSFTSPTPHEWRELQSAMGKASLGPGTRTALESILSGTTSL